MKPRTLKGLRAFYNAAETRVPMRHDVARGMRTFERLAFPERFRRSKDGRLIRKSRNK